VLVRRTGDDYELVAGERSWRAATRAGLQKIPAVVKELSDSDAIQVALVENLQRQDLDPLEEAEAFSRLIRDYGLDQAAVADAVGKSRSAVANSLRLLKLPTPVLQMLADGRLTAGHARAIMMLNTELAQTKLAETIVERGMSVRDAERQARVLNKKPKQKKDERTPAELDVEQKLQSALGTRVRLRNRRGKGRIEVYFHSLEQLNDLIDRLT
jgi:ParB family chromosome partitioning protein